MAFHTSKKVFFLALNREHEDSVLRARGEIQKHNEDYGYLENPG